MKKVMFYVFIIVVLVGYSSLKPKKVDVAIDNPTDQPITLSLDELVVEIPAKEVVWAEMGKGKHTITLEDGSEHPFDYTQSAYMINPTRSEYLVQDVFYGSESSQASYEAKFAGKSVEFMGIEMEGNYEVVKDLVAPVTWDVGARESSPTTVQADSDEPYVVLRKLVGPSEFNQLLIQSMLNFEAEIADEPQEEAEQ